MCDQTEINYLDEEVVWVKLGSCWWPGEVVGFEKLPPHFLSSFRKPPIAVVKFFQEDTYEYVKSASSIYKYNCSRKNEFINKGLYMYRTKHGPMEKFPEDIIRAETATGGDIAILTRDEFQEVKKESYAGIFGTPKIKNTPGSVKKGKGRARHSESYSLGTPVRKIKKEKTDYKVHILVQGGSTSSQEETSSTPSTSIVDSDTDTPKKVERPTSTFSTPTASSSGEYTCHACAFTTSRLNVMILHNKTHSATFIPYTPSPVRKKSAQKAIPKVRSTSNKIVKVNDNKAPKARRSRKEKTEKESKNVYQGQKRVSDKEKESTEVKKPKTEEEIKSSLLADWDDIDEESNDETSLMVMAASPELPVAADSPAVPTPAELPTAEIPPQFPSAFEKKSSDLQMDEKPESSSSKYDFCEDEDWLEEADVGRKIPRVKNPSKRKEDTKSLSLDDDDMAREVAELLNKTTVPELPSAPESLRVEENFPEPSIVKSPDKKPEQSPEVSKSEKAATEATPTKAIFKTKTFFRSRHSRSQDAIGKYVAEQLNAAERLDPCDNEINGSEMVSSPEARDSPTIEHLKTARLAPKIQLKKMKAEAAQLREKNDLDNLCEDIFNTNTENATKSTELTKEKENAIYQPFKPLEDVMCSTQEIKQIPQELTKEETNEICLEENVNDEETVHQESTVVDTNELESNEELPIIQDKNTEEKLKDNIDVHVMNHPEDNLQKYDKTSNRYMNESTASAVDALLSVSRETDRVTKVISDDPPEDLFEDDNKDNATVHNVNGFIEGVNKESANDESELKLKELCETNQNQNEIQNDSYSEGTSQETSQEAVDENMLLSENVAIEVAKEVEINEVVAETITENVLSESDLQIAEALINLPSTAIQNKISNDHVDCLAATSVETEPFEEQIVETSEDMDVESSENVVVVDDNKNYKSKEDKESYKEQLSSESLVISSSRNINTRFQTEQEQSENLNAAQSLVQMSECIVETNTVSEIQDSTANVFNSTRNGVDTVNTVKQNVELPEVKSNNSTATNGSTNKLSTNSSKLLKMLEEPKMCINMPSLTKRVVITGNERILNFDVGKSTLKNKPQTPRQKIIIRRSTPNKNVLTNLNETNSPNKIILSCNNINADQDGSVQTYTIQPSLETPNDGNTIIIQPKLRKIKPTTKFQKVNPQTSLTPPLKETKTVTAVSTTDNTIFDINSMPVVLSDDILTPESIEKMPIVMSDGNLVTNSANTTKVVKPRQATIESEKIAISSVSNKQEMRTLLMSPAEGNKVTTPNILSKSSKLRPAKPMLVIDKTTGKRKIIMTKAEPTLNEVKQKSTKIHPTQSVGKPEQLLILPSASSPRPNRTQKIVIDPQTGKAHVIVTKGPETSVSVSKPVSAKLLSAATDAGAPTSTVMIITDAQGAAQSRIVLTPEHEKIYFPNKQANVPQLKTITQQTNSACLQKPSVSTGAPVKTQTRLVPKQKGAIITSKGQLIVEGRVATNALNIAPMPEIRPTTKRIIAAEPKRVVQTIQKNTSEPVILLHQKSGAVMQLTAAQFEHLKRTGQLVTAKSQVENKILVQKSITIPPNEIVLKNSPKPRMRKIITESSFQAKKVKSEIAIAPAPAPPPPMPALAPITNTAQGTVHIPTVTTAAPVLTPTSYPDLDKLEELLPSTSGVKHPETAPSAEILATPASAPAALSDGHLLAMPGETFGGPPGSFYLCVEGSGVITPIDNRPLVLENNQLVPMVMEPLPVLAPQPERRDILKAALANSDVFHADASREDAPDFRDLNANVSVHCRVSETSTTLNQPIMTPVEMPTKADTEPAIPSNLEDGLAVIGVTSHTVPTSLELPITVTDPRIAPKTTDPLSNNNYRPTLLPSPSTEMSFVATEEAEVSSMRPISMPLLTEEEVVGKSMPILTDEVPEGGTPSPGGACAWPRTLLTPGSDTSDNSVEIPLQPAIQLSAAALQARDA